MFETMDIEDVDFKELSKKDIKEVLLILNPPKTAINSTKFILTTLITGRNQKELRELNSNISDEVYNKYLTNLENAEYFDETGFPKINKTDDNLIPEIKFARYVAEGVFSGKYITKNYYKFDFSKDSNKKEVSAQNIESDKELFNYEWMKIIQDKMTGQIYLKKNDSTVIIPFIDNRHVLLEYQFRPAIKKYSFEFPAGGILNEKDLETSVNKRLIEETGYIATEVKPLLEAYPSPGIYSSKHYYVVAKKVIPLQKADNKIEVRIFDFNKIPHYIKTGEIFDSKTILAYLYYKEIVKNNLK